MAQKADTWDKIRHKQKGTKLEDEQLGLKYADSGRLLLRTMGIPLKSVILLVGILKFKMIQVGAGFDSLSLKKIILEKPFLY